MFLIIIINLINEACTFAGFSVTFTKAPMQCQSELTRWSCWAFETMLLANLFNFLSCVRVQKLIMIT